ncbi:hypothetical protein FA13DRAFT_1728582 [Coprinellus micaceus]|uniref:Uncharacterized protein n=1 Tax=Coprinellus micaceus TaxID=71717 RepID=A0A4Y7TQ80_COPMI|nr:hypothetical protein FA13DRAFT_1728582 [Coprinellus micaceus]
MTATGDKAFNFTRTESHRIIYTGSVEILNLKAIPQREQIHRCTNYQCPCYRCGADPFFHGWSVYLRAPCAQFPA